MIAWLKLVGAESGIMSIRIKVLYIVMQYIPVPER